MASPVMILLTLCLISILLIPTWSHPTSASLSLPTPMVLSLAVEIREFLSHPGEYRTTSTEVPTTTEAPSATITATYDPFTSTRSPYTGQAILTGTCATPIFSVLSFPSPNVRALEVLLVGCSDERPDCCPSLQPFPTSTSSLPSRAGRIKSDGGISTATGVVSALNASPLAVCPSDFVNLSGACCPSGFTLYPTALYSHVVPCYSSLATAMTEPPEITVATPPSSSQATSSSAPPVATTIATQSSPHKTPEPVIPPRHGPPTHGGKREIADRSVEPGVVMITNQVFALGLPLASDGYTDAATSHHGLSKGVKAAVGIGAAAGAAVLVAVAALAWCWHVRVRRGRAQDQNQNQVNQNVSTNGKRFGGNGFFVELVERDGAGKGASKDFYDGGRRSGGDGKAVGEKNDSRVSVDSLGKPVSVFSLA